MKQSHYPIAVAALICLLLGIACFLLLIFVSVNWFDALLYAYLIFFILSIVLGGYSLTIKKSKLGWASLIVGSVFILLFFAILYLFRDLCVIC